MIKMIFATMLMAASCSVTHAALQCGPFKLETQQDGAIFVNGVKPKKQTVSWSGAKGDKDNVAYHLVVKNTKAPGMLAMDNIYHQGTPTLKAEVVRTSSSQIRLTGSYDCETVE